MKVIFLATILCLSTNSVFPQTTPTAFPEKIPALKFYSLCDSPSATELNEAQAILDNAMEARKRVLQQLKSLGNLTKDARAEALKDWKMKVTYQSEGAASVEESIRDELDLKLKALHLGLEGFQLNQITRKYSISVLERGKAGVVRSSGDKKVFATERSKNTEERLEIAFISPNGDEANWDISHSILEALSRLDQAKPGNEDDYNICLFGQCEDDYKSERFLENVQINLNAKPVQDLLITYKEFKQKLISSEDAEEIDSNP